MINLEEIGKELDQLSKEKKRIEKELDQLSEEKEKIEEEIEEKINLVNMQKTLYIKEIDTLFTIGFYDCHYNTSSSLMSFNNNVEHIKWKMGIKDINFENYCCINFKSEVKSYFGRKRMFFKNKEDAQKWLDWIESLIVMEKLIK